MVAAGIEQLDFSPDSDVVAAWDAVAVWEAVPAFASSGQANAGERARVRATIMRGSRVWPV